MSAVADRVLSIAKPEAPSSNGVWVPLVGGLWVLANVGLAALGIYIDCGTDEWLTPVGDCGGHGERATPGWHHRTPGRTQPERAAQ